VINFYTFLYFMTFVVTWCNLVQLKFKHSVCIGLAILFLYLYFLSVMELVDQVPFGRWCLNAEMD